MMITKLKPEVADFDIDGNTEASQVCTKEY